MTQRQLGFIITDTLLSVITVGAEDPIAAAISNVCQMACRQDINALLGIDVRLLHQALAVNSEGITCKGPDGIEVLVEGQTVICALGQRSNVAAVEALADAAPFVRVIGDAARMATITQAVYQGYHAALDI